VSIRHVERGKTSRAEASRSVRCGPGGKAFAPVRLGSSFTLDATVTLLRRWAPAWLLVTGCSIASLPPASSRSDGGPVASRGVVSHEARSQLRLYRDAAGCESVQTLNRQFRLVSVRGPDGSPRRLVLEESYDIRHCLTAESSSSEAVVTVWRPDSATKEPVFRITGRGVRGEPAGNLYRMVAAGCCGSQNLIIYFSLITGRAVASSSVPIVALGLDQGLSRFAGFQDTYSAGAPPELQADSSVIGVLVWADDRMPLQRFALLADDPEPFSVASISYWQRGRRIPDSALAQWSKDSVGSLALEIQLVAPATDRRVTVRIPIEDLLLVPGQAQLPPGIHLRAGR